jgi:hypothetical protein
LATRDADATRGSRTRLIGSRIEEEYAYEHGVNFVHDTAWRAARDRVANRQHLEQIWRDHLLALACQQASPDVVAVRYVLLAPADNPAWPAVSEK